jgi:hypothetical protein
MTMRGIAILDLSFPEEMQDPDLQVKCLTYIASHAKEICPDLPATVRLFILRGRAPHGGRELPLLGLHERPNQKTGTGWNYLATLEKLQQWIDGQDPAQIVAQISKVQAPTFADLDDRKQ